MNAPTLPSIFSSLAAGSSALADAPWWIMIPLLLPAIPALASAIATLATACSHTRTAAMRRRHEDTFLEDPDRYRAGLDHIARMHQPTTALPPPEPAAPTQQPAEPPTPPP
ncbi:MULTISPECIES: hypothetical protein [unclassified Streptomyces]|uniref:hypothetical protein n=1 Tax=unclassified Streptomyces TaxID=2593676 RepID=UPI00070C7457|nr:hypothetical protein [Streptomyces sp. Root1310]KQX68631.1 hypothetical protein ASD48_40955 [Streptomyces sp. Root1310]